MHSYYVFLLKGSKVYKPMLLPVDPWDSFLRMARIAIRGRKVDFGIIVSKKGSVSGIVDARDYTSATNAVEVIANHSDAYPKFAAALAKALVDL
jgi:hypothetical protein